jgi:hypothetical protein
MISIFSEDFLRALFRHPLIGLELSEDEISDTIGLLRSGQKYLWGGKMYLSYIGRDSFSIGELNVHES